VEFGDNVAFVSLAGVIDPDFVMQTVVAALGVRDTPGQEAVHRAVGNERLLLVLDNFEHVLPAAPAIAALLNV
jgi:predicted ATPase